MTRRIPDVPKMQDPGLYEFLQAVRRQLIVMVNLEETFGEAITNPGGRPYRLINMSGSINPGDAGGIIQLNQAGIQLTFPSPTQDGFAYGQTVEVLNYLGPVSIMATGQTSLVNVKTGALIGAQTPLSIPAQNRTIVTAGFDRAWWVEIARP